MIAPSMPRGAPEMAEKYDWDAADVLAFLHREREPSKKMLRELTTELDVPVEELQHIFDR